MQLELSFRAPEQPDLEEVAKLAVWLYQIGDEWVTARRITAALDLTDRQIRHLAAASGGVIVSGPGCPGYKHVRHCDPDELRTVASRLEHQAKLMAERAAAIRRQFHRAAHR